MPHLHSYSCVDTHRKVTTCLFLPPPMPYLFSNPVRSEAKASSQLRRRDGVVGYSFSTSPGARRRPGRWPRGGRGRQARPAASRGARTSDTLMGDLPGAATSQRVRTADQRCSGPLPIFPGGPHVDHMAVKVVADGCIGVQLRWTSGRAVLVDGARFIDCFYIDLCSIWDTICIRFGMCARYDLLSPCDIVLAKPAMQERSDRFRLVC